MSETNPTMDIIVNEGLDRMVYPGSSRVEVSKSLPEYRGGVTMTIRVQSIEPEPINTPITIDPGPASVMGLGPSLIFCKGWHLVSYQNNSPIGIQV